MKENAKYKWLWLSIILFFTLLAYFKIISFDFVYWDDDKQIFNNIYVSHLTLEHIKHNFQYERFTFIPLTLYSILYQIVGKDPLYFHLFSLVFHLINVIVFFITLNKFRFNLFVTVLSSILFALHPMRIESVAWISEWKDLLFTFFSICGILFYLNWIKENKIIYILLYITMVVFSAFSKIQGLLLPLTVVLLDIFIQKKLRLNFALLNVALLAFVLLIYVFEVRIFAFFILMIFLINRKYNFLKFKSNLKIKPLHYIVFILFITIILSWFFISKQLWFWEGVLKFSLTDRLVFSGYALTFYIQQFFLPIKQIAVYPYPDFSGIELWRNWGIYLIIWILSFFIFIWLYKRKYFVELFGFLFFIINISIVLHFVPIEGRLLVADRYTYFAYAGLILSTTHLFNRFLTEKLLLQIIIKLFFIVAFTIIVFIRVDVWKNTVTLFYNVLKKNPKTAFAWLNLGSYYLGKNDFVEAKKYYSIALRFEPKNSQLLLNKSLAHVALNETDSAINCLNKALNYSKNNEEKSLILLTIGQINAEKGYIQNAINYYDQAIALYSNNYKAYLQKALIFANVQEIRNIDSAIHYAKKSIEINSYYADSYNTLSWLYLLKQDIFNAKNYALASIKANSYYSLAYNTLGYIYQIENKYDSALYYYEKALMLDSTLLDVRKNRAWAYFNLNKFYASLNDYNYVLSKNPNDLIALTNRAFCYMRLNQFHMAIADFKNVLLLQKDSADNYYNVAWAYIQAKQIDSALNYLNKTININNKHVKAIFDRALIYLNKNSYNDALDDFNFIKSLYPDNAEIYYWIGMVYNAKSEKNKACDYFKISYSKGYQGAKKFVSKCEN